VTEVAYFDDPRVMDTSVTDRIRKDAFLESLTIAKEGSDFLIAQLNAVRKDLKGNSPFQTSVEWWAGLTKNQEARRNWAENAPEMQKPATVAEVFSNTVVSQFYRLLSIGMLVRMLEGEIAIGNGTPAIRKQLVEARQTFEAWADKLEGALNYRVVPIRKLVAVQLGSVLATANYLSQQRGSAA
jgi:hypothetical protein